MNYSDTILRKELMDLKYKIRCLENKIDCCCCCPIVPGPRGKKGLQGMKGAQGTDGAQGGVGLQGEAGPQGEKGMQGADGTQGGVGLQGAQGMKGMQGLQGVQGMKGIQGAVGSQGSSGFNNATLIFSTVKNISNNTITAYIGQGTEIQPDDRIISYVCPFTTILNTIHVAIKPRFGARGTLNLTFEVRDCQNNMVISNAGSFNYSFGSNNDNVCDSVALMNPTLVSSGDLVDVQIQITELEALGDLGIAVSVS